MRDRGAVRRVALAAVDERMAVELVADRRAHGAGAAAVDDADRSAGRRARRRRRTTRTASRASCARCPRTSSSSETSPRAAATHPHRRLGRLAARGVPRRTQARERDPQPHGRPGRPPRPRRPRSRRSCRGRRVPAPRPGRRPRAAPVSGSGWSSARSARSARAARVGGGAEPAVALASAAGAVAAVALALAPARRADLRRAAPRAPRAPSARSRCASAARALALGRRRRAHRLDLGLELGLALARVARASCVRLGALALGRLALARRRRARPPPPRRAAPRSAAARASTVRARVRDDVGVEPEPLRDLKRVRRARPAERDPVERRVRVGVEARRRVRDAVGRARPLLQLGVVRRHERQPRLLARAARASACASAEPSTGSVPAASSSSSTSERSVGRVEDRDDVARRGRRRSRGSSRSTARSPMSASTWSKTGSAAVSAGGRSPDWWSSAARPSVFSATVLPPVFGPLIDERAQVAELEVDRHGRRRVEQRMPRAEQPHLVGRPRRARRASAARASPRASARSIAPVASTSGVERVRRARRRRRELAQDPLDLLALGARRLRLAVVQLDDRRTARRRASARSSDASWTMPGTLRRALAFTASTGRPPRSVTKSSWRCSRSSLERAELLELLGHALPAVAQLAAQPAQLRRGVVAQVGAVLLDAAVDRLGERRERRVDRGRELAQERRGSPARRGAPRARARPRPPVGDVPQRRRRRATPPRAACAAAVAHVARSRRAAARRQLSSSAIASAVSAWRRATSSRSADGVERARELRCP